ncbi:exo-beta-1,3-glucanase [Thelephora ganbajun]|uniref:Exo-beta-1,3-glucanase n=1 Tax=Thelephora ganbajun TaxID=370292 RepID=A0ACB6ZF90_THEGA|nr:exo-beta-1,3-glucanase [Thelephora ganbajun]
MLFHLTWVLAFAPTHLAYVAALGSECTVPLCGGNAPPNEPYWLEKVKHQGIAAYNPDPTGYKVFRNVKDYGAIGDGVADDTEAILRAISTGPRCGQDCGSSTISPATVYFPQGTYLVTDSIPLYYYTEVIGDARKPPTILAAASFNPAALAIFDADPYIPGGNGNQWYVNQNNFFRSVKNLQFDTTLVPPEVVATCIHWQVSQATSLYNLVFKLSAANGTQHRAVQMENGSGGFMGDLIIDGGNIGLDVGNQQFTVRNVTINDSNTGVRMAWNWGWNFQGITINNAQVGFEVSVDGVGGIAIIDAVVRDTLVFYRSSRATDRLQSSIVLNNVQATNVSTIVGIVGGETILAGSAGHTYVDTWVQGNVYAGHDFEGYTQDYIAPISKDWSLLEDGRIFGKGRPMYADYDITQIISVKDHGAKGDGRTDDTAALQKILDRFSGCKIIFFDAGIYLVSDTLKIPAGVHIFGETWAVIAGTGSKFSDIDNPKTVVQVGAPASKGTAEIGGIVFSTRGPTAGAIVLQWNVYSETKGCAGMWDSYIRLGGAAGSELQLSECPKTDVGNRQCFAAFLAVHLTRHSNAYFEGTWIWLADHDMETLNSNQTTIYSGRGLLSESQGPVWLIGTGSEHHVIVNYNLAGAANHYIGLPQTESPYYQPNPPPPNPLFTTLSEWKDPSFNTNQTSAWGLYITKSRDILVFGAGLYSFFINYDASQCSTADRLNCQSEILNVDSRTEVSIYNLATVGTTYQLSIDSSPVIPAAGNGNGFSRTVTAWTPW